MSPDEKNIISDQDELPKIGLTNNVIFRHVFVSRERKSYLLAMVNALLELQGDEAFQSLEIIDSIQSREHLKDREAVVDIIAVDGNGKQVHVEVQLINHPGFVARILYYWGKLYTRQLGPADSFSKLKPTVSLVITDFFVSDEENRLHAHWCLSCRYTKEARSNLIGLHFIQLPALVEDQIKGRMNKWVFAFKHGRDILNSQEVPLLLMEEKELVMAIDEAKKALVTDEDLRQRALSQEMMMRDQISIVADNVEAALKRGMELGETRGFYLGEGKGRTEGQIEGKLKFCLELYQDGTMDSDAARSKMQGLLGSGFDDLVQKYLDQLPPVSG